MPFTLYDEQDDFLLINKSPDTNFHCEDGELGLFEHVKRSLNRPSLLPVHRLDKMTSGALLFAKNKTAAHLLSEQFKQRQIEKFYLALSDGKPKKKQGLIKGDMVKSRRGSWKLLTSQQNPAITQFFSTSVQPGLRLFLIKPHTGKTHQIRVALNSIGAAALGDPLYHAKTDSVIDRGYLHAYGLGFTFKGKTFQYLVPPLQGTLFLATATQTIIQEHYSNPSALPWPKLSTSHHAPPST